MNDKDIWSDDPETREREVTKTINDLLKRGQIFVCDNGHYFADIKLLEKHIANGKCRRI